MDKILFNDEKAAKLITVDLWQSTKGMLFNEESDARYDSCTHNLCECGTEKEKHVSLCYKCVTKIRAGKYNSLPMVEWDEEGMINCYQHDIFFLSWDDVIEYCIEAAMHPKDLLLVLSEPGKIKEIDPYDYLDLALDDLSLPKEIEEAFRQLNDTISQYNRYRKPFYYEIGHKKAVSIPEDVIKDVVEGLKELGINVA